MSRQQGLDGVELDVRYDEIGTRQLTSQNVTLRDRHPNAVPGSRACRGFDRMGIHVDREDRLKAKARGGNSDHPGPAARVENAPALFPGQELDAGSRRRMRPGAEGASRVDDDGRLARRSCLPRRADPEPAGTDWSVERAPAILPARLDRGRGRMLENGADALLAREVGVDGELEIVAGLDLLESRGRQREQSRAGDLRLGGGYANGDAAEAQVGQRGLPKRALQAAKEALVLVVRGRVRLGSCLLVEVLE